MEGMLAVATAQTQHRSRWLWPLAAAVALLVIPLVTVVGVSGSHQSATSPTPDPAGFLGDIAWFGAVLQADHRTLSVAVYPDRQSYCPGSQLPDLHAVVSETATTVSIRAQAFRASSPSPTPSAPAGAAPVCSDLGPMPMALTVELRQPLGSRSLLDATTGTRHLVFEASTLLTPSWLPAGYVDRIIRWEREPHDDVVVHEYHGPGKDQLFVARGPNPPAPALAGETVLATGTVLGHPAKVTRYPATPTTTCAFWTDSGYSWSICSWGPDPRHSPLDAEELLRIGNSMR
ncbi:hypothetical protein [Jatrophihabitans sp.]|uniref:hypothetical protein n=1 Tax=Jatrophihabitans sp. TaxID=1932789 RepID=UPI0038CD5897